MIEFISEGSDLKNHADRFKKKGAYSKIPRNSYLIVDFRASTKEIKIFI